MTRETVFIHIAPFAIRRSGCLLLRKTKALLVETMDEEVDVAENDGASRADGEQKSDSHMDLRTVLNTFVGGGAGVAVMEWVLRMVEGAAAEKVLAAYMAMRLAVVLEAFTSPVLQRSFLTTPTPLESPEEEFPDWKVRLQIFLPFPTMLMAGGDHRKLAGRCLNLPK